ncbi:hypothetical protein D3C86_232370 [compost metagenome]
MAMGTGTGAPHFFCTLSAASCQSGFSRKIAQMFSGFEGGAVAQPPKAISRVSSSGGPGLIAGFLVHKMAAF